MQTYSLLDHTADLGIRVMGKTLEDLFVHAGLALSDLLVKKGARTIRSLGKIQLAVSGMDWPGPDGELVAGAFTSMDQRQKCPILGSPNFR